MSKGKYSISVSQGRVAHDHDNRDYTPHNADRGLRNRNVIIKQTEDYKSAFNELFRDSIEAYNAKQKREDRKSRMTTILKLPTARARKNRSTNMCCKSAVVKRWA